MTALSGARARARATAAASASAGTFALAVAHARQHFGARRLGRRLHHIPARGFAGTAPDGLASHGDGLGFFAGFGHEAFNNLHGDVLLGVALDVLHEAFFVQTNQIHRRAIGAGATGAANAVHIVFADVGDVVIDHVGQIIDVDAARGNVGGHQRANVAALEAGERLGARRLALVAVQRHRIDAVLDQELRDIVRAEFGAREHQHLAPVVFLDDVGQQRLLFAAADRVDELRDALHRGVARRDLDALRVLEQRGGEIANFVAERGREQQALLVPGHHGKHFFHVMDETHVEHAVGFIEHEHLHLAQI